MGRKVCLVTDLRAELGYWCVTERKREEEIVGSSSVCQAGWHDVLMIA